MGEGVRIGAFTPLSSWVLRRSNESRRDTLLERQCIIFYT